VKSSKQSIAKKIRGLLRDVRDWREGFAGVKTVLKGWKAGSYKEAISRKSDHEILDEVERRLLQIAKEAADAVRKADK
jgi:hypothetical protein